MQKIRDDNGSERIKGNAGVKVHHDRTVGVGLDLV